MSFKVIDKLLLIKRVVYRLKCFSLLFGSSVFLALGWLLVDKSVQLHVLDFHFWDIWLAIFLLLNCFQFIRVWEFNDIFILLLVQLFQFLVIVPGLVEFRFSFQRKHIIRGLTNRFDKSLINVSVILLSIDCWRNI